MRYVTYDDTGTLTGSFLQDVAAEHTECYIEVDDDTGINWVNFRANEDRTGVELLPAPGIDLAAVRAAKWEAIKAERDRRKAAGVKVGDYWLHSDTDSRVQWLGLKDTARDLLAASADAADVIMMFEQPILWKTMGGSFVPVTIQLALDVVQATKELDGKLFKAAELHRAAMEASADPTAYDHLAGWPLVYGEVPA